MNAKSSSVRPKYIVFYTFIYHVKKEKRFFIDNNKKKIEKKNVTPCMIGNRSSSRRSKERAQSFNIKKTYKDKNIPVCFVRP